VQVRAQLVVVACGAIQTPVLLMRSGIRSPSGQLGKNLSIHPNSKVVAIFDDPVRGWEGVHQAYQVREFHREGLLFAAVNVPPAILAMTLPRYGGALGELMEAYPRMVIAGVLVEDESRGRVLAGPLGPVVTYQLGQRDAERLVRGSLLLAELLMAAGARRVLLPLAGLPELRSPDDLVRLAALPVRRAALEVLTVHLMGTARMGADRGRAVTDAFGLVHDAERLAICDASLFPGPIGVNPAETIQALATRTAHHLIEHRHRYLS
jgi:choline dehydrogenase-like flavoprotein